MNSLIWTILYLVSVVGVACVIFLIADKPAITLEEAFAGLFIALFWPLVLAILAATAIVALVFTPIMYLDDYCYQRGWTTKDWGKTVVWRRKS